MSRSPSSVLFVCSMNRVRSPMAAALARRLYGGALRVESSGLHACEEVDGMAAVVMQEVGADIFDHRPRPLSDVAPEDFDLIVALSPDAWEVVRGLAHGDVEVWPIDDPTVEEGPRDMRLDAYRKTRRDLEARITDRLGPPSEQT